MLRLSNIGKSFGGRMVLSGVSFTLGAGERAGLVGPNASGKTTLLRIIMGEERPDAGSVEIPPDVRLGYLRQGHAGAHDRPVAEVFPALFAVATAEQRLAELAARMAAETDPERAADAADAYARAVDTLERAPALTPIEAARRALGLRAVGPEERVGALSGGEQTKLGLLGLLAARPDLLLLDEPTNHLDIAGLQWLDGFLESFGGPALVVAHDRAFLDDHVATILELDPATGRLEAFAGNYSDYAEEKAWRHEEQWARYRRQQKHERRVEAAIADLKARAQRTENRTINFYFKKRAAKVARRAVTLQRRLQRELDSVAHVDKPIRLPHRVRAEITEGQRAGARMVAAERLGVSAGGRTLLRDVDLVIGWGERIALVGPNGSGKTTLLRTLLGEQPPAAGDLRVAPSVRVGYLPQDGRRAEDAADGATPLEVIRRATPFAEGEARRFLHRFLFAGDQPLTPIARLSYGERRRLDLARLVVTGANLLLLDEPTNHLDIQSREAFESALDAFEGAVLVVTHDRYFIARYAERVLVIEDGRLVWEVG